MIYLPLRLLSNAAFFWMARLSGNLAKRYQLLALIFARLSFPPYFSPSNSQLVGGRGHGIVGHAEARPVIDSYL